MNEFLFYNLKAAVCLAVFYLFFKWMLSRETFHRFNRILLLSGIIAALILPVCVLTLYRELSVLPVTEAVVESVAEPMGGEMPAPELLRRTLISVFFWIAVAGMAAALLRWGRSLWEVGRTIRRGCRERLADGGVLVRVAEPVTPFSWMRYIVVYEADLDGDGSYILLHEQAHLRFGHSWDLLFVDLLCCLQWFNPAMWLLRRELRSIHEYEADAAVLEAGADARSYQLLLIRKAVGGRWYSAANSFNHHKLKNRIDMMLREKSTRRAGARALLLVPLLGVAIGAFAQTVYRTPEPVHGRMQTVVVNGDSLVVDGVKEMPLIVVDGVRAESLDEVDAAGIESITVLKGASATELYGDSGRNGVIVVTQKKGAEGYEAAYRVTVTTRNDEPDAATSPSCAVKDGADSEVCVTTAKMETTAAGAGTDPGMKYSSVVVTARKGAEEPDGQTMTVTTTMDAADAAEIASGAPASSREALTESRAASQEGLEAAQAALDEARKALADSRTASKNGLESARGALKKSRRALEAARLEIDKALEGAEGSDVTIRMGGPDGYVKLNQPIEAGGRLILIDGEKATQKEMDRVLRKKVRKVNIWTGEDAVRKFGDKGRNGVVEIRTRK